MGAISLRGVDDELSERLKQNAKQEDKSLNQYILEVLRREAGLVKDRRFTARHHDLDHLFGTWTPEEFAAIDGEIASGRQVDRELWE